jgi:hypothetical protein
MRCLGIISIIRETDRTHKFEGTISELTVVGRQGGVKGAGRGRGERIAE